jgi:hypothetical protein
MYVCVDSRGGRAWCGIAPTAFVKREIGGPIEAENAAATPATATSP